MLNYRRLHLALLLAAGLVISSATSRAVDPRLLPANTELVFTVNLKQILDSDLVKANGRRHRPVKAALDMLPNGGEVTKYLKLLGFDPFTHLTSVSVAHPGNKDPKELFVVIDGIFDAKKFADTADTAIQDYPGIIKKYPSAPPATTKSRRGMSRPTRPGRRQVAGCQRSGRGSQGSHHPIHGQHHRGHQGQGTAEDHQRQAKHELRHHQRRRDASGPESQARRFPAGAGGAGDITGITGASP